MMFKSDTEHSQLTAIGLSAFAEHHQRILSEIISGGIPTNYAVLTEATAEALIQAVAAMIEENNKNIKEPIL